MNSIFTFGLSPIPSKFFPMLLIHSAFLLCSLRCHILLQNCFASLTSGCGNVLCHLLQLVSRFFLVLWNVLFCQYCFTLSRYLFNISYFASTWGVLSVLIALLFLFYRYMFQQVFLCFIIFACCRWFLIGVSSQISHPNFEFLFVLGGNPDSFRD